MRLLSEFIHTKSCRVMKAHVWLGSRSQGFHHYRQIPRCRVSPGKRFTGLGGINQRETLYKRTLSCTSSRQNDVGITHVRQEQKYRPAVGRWISQPVGGKILHCGFRPASQEKAGTDCRGHGSNPEGNVEDASQHGKPCRHSVFQPFLRWRISNVHHETPYRQDSSTPGRVKQHRLTRSRRSALL